MKDRSQSSPAPLHRDALLDFFHRGATAVDDRGVGTEHEKFVVHRHSGRVVSHEEPGGLGDLFDALVHRFQWTPHLDGDHVVAVTRDDASVTLEPGGQFELSGGIKRTIFETADEFDRHLDELHSIGGDDLLFAIWGMNPTHGLEDIPWMPKSRYAIMRRYLPTRGAMAHWMMKTSCTIQANFDYTSEQDAVDLIQVAVLASPLVGALFANSPYQAGTDTGMQSRRNHIWRHTDPDRTGVPSFMYRDQWGFEDYLDYILDVPMFFIERQGRLVDMAGHSFRDFMAQGYQDHQATLDDFELHLSTTFPDIRLKQYVEVRSADGGPREAVLALPALWKGLLYDDDARREFRTLMEPFDEASHRALTVTCYEEGLHGRADGHSIAELCDQLVAISERGLQRIAADADHRSEAHFLTPLKQRLKGPTSYADLLRQDIDDLGLDLSALAEKWAL